ncbi:acid stress response protein YqgB [Entomohabitans teleogrylli]|nr:acid stress response protein YqgB [Entomohabitans teleogrylli]
MNKKPVAQGAKQRIVLDNRVFCGLLSPLATAIVVNCFTLMLKIEVRNV